MGILLLLLMAAVVLAAAFGIRLRRSHKQLTDLRLRYQPLLEREDSISKLEAQIRQRQAELESFNSKAAKQEEALQSRLSKQEAEALKQEAKIKARISKQETEASRKEAKIRDQIAELETKLYQYEEEDFLQEFGYYEPKYHFEWAQDYKKTLEQVVERQKQMIKAGKAAVCSVAWTVGNSRREGERMTNNNLKLLLRAFNGECDAAIAKVRYNNVASLERRIHSAYNALNKLGKVIQSEITQEYLQVRLKELNLSYEYQAKLQEEQEEQRRIREQMREEERAERELEKAKLEAEREERRYQNALSKARAEVETAVGKEKEKLDKQIAELQQRLAEAESTRQRATSMAQMTKSGYVYIISNIGSFGEQVYKIGMTRRLDPMDRVKELGDASVPFPFDVHAMIFCENAPELENRLHKHFSARRLNKINERKEFFQVDLDEIELAVKQISAELNLQSTQFTLTKIAEAAEYRNTLAKERAV